MKKQEPCAFCGGGELTEPMKEVCFTAPDQSMQISLTFNEGMLSVKVVEHPEQAEENMIAGCELEYNYCPICGRSYNDAKRLEKAIAQAKHCIGLDHAKPYKRNGKSYYRYYRNSFSTVSTDEIWTWLEKHGYASRGHESTSVSDLDPVTFCTFHLTEKGIQWLAESLDIAKITPQP